MSCECLSFTPSAVARESFATQLCLPTALTHGRFASSLCLSLSLSVSLSPCLSLSLSVSLSLCLAWGQGHGRAQADTGPQALPEQQVVPLSFLSDQLVSQQHISHLFVRAMAAAGLGLRKSGKSNFEQVAEDESHSPVLVLASEHQQQWSASDLTLPQQHQQTAVQMQSASSSLDQPQVGLEQYQPTGNDRTPTPTRFPVQYQPAGKDLTTSAGANANSV